ncbi:hypothetical protein [Pedobacter punctiformis]|uniref:Lipoprotein n=1 Tax=Pedobacter punctiformis TaxID=3004097 RepID=A0ABT4L882_9SPHI|nr:hypothetical protein [Pedobacter sp. HCMS5-2]MCZ4244137.1 hypothetical protein [Pedobacter sp. HCMS5-2]
MKNICLAFIAMVLMACHTKTKTTKQSIVDDKQSLTDTAKYVVEPVYKEPVSPIDTVANSTKPLENEEASTGCKDSIAFDQYPAVVSQNFTKAPLDWESNPSARYFRTRIIDAYKSNTIDFAGHYIGVIFGCGADCIAGFMIDVRDGKIYDAPLGEENSCFFSDDKAICESSSLLFISAVCRENIDDKKAYYLAYLWNEESKKFERIKSEEFLKKK